MDLAGLVDLPWNRVGVWAVVVWFMYSLKDFFGVRHLLTGLPCSASYCGDVSLRATAERPERSFVSADCYGDFHLVLHWEWLCQIRTEGTPLPASDIAPDQAKDSGEPTDPDPL